ncbi:MAG: hypothetical protein ACLFOY_01465 [Desulfatibacillaceae bacterium]
MGNDIVLDDAAEELFRELGGTDGRTTGGGFDTSGLAETLHEQDRKIDPWRLLLVQFSCDIATFIEAWRKGNLREAEESVKKLDVAIGKLNKMPDHDGRVLIRHQGRGIPGEGRAAMDYDYSVMFGPIYVDIPVIRAMAARIGYSASEYPGEFTRALDSLAEANICSIFLRVQEQTREYHAQMGKAFTALGPFIRLLSSEATMAKYGGRDGKKLPVVYDEFEQPDPNLTLMASVNKQKRSDVQALVGKLNAMRNKPELKQNMESFPTAFDSIFAFKKLREQLNRPLIEVNNVRWLVAYTDKDSLNREQAAMTRFALRVFGKDDLRLARLLDTLYAMDFKFESAYQIADRLGLATQLMKVIEGKAGPEHPLLKHLLNKIAARLDRVPDDVLENLTVSGNEAKARIGAEDTIRKDLSPRLIELLEFYRQRAVTRNKVKSMLRQRGQFTDDDYRVMARDFGIAEQEARDLVDLLKNCFDPAGHFLRRSFEKKIPEFCKHEDKVFEFLWHFLKEHMHSHERIGFLNSLKVMIDRMKQTQRGLEVLLQDFSHDPERVTFSDRNALMLCNALLRSFNKELHQDIEMTPEEVLKVRAGLDQEAVAFARDLMDGQKEKYYIKFRTIHRELKRSLGGGGSDTMPVRYVMTLEREAYMLFALVGGVTGRAILRSGLNEYGDPEADIYHHSGSGEQLNWLVQILQVLIRAIGRVGEKEDIQTLREIRPREMRFFNLAKDQRHVDQVRRMYRWMDASEEELKERYND